MRDTNLTIKDIREAIGMKEKAERAREYEYNVLEEYLKDQGLVNQYINDKLNYIDRAKDDQEAVQKLIEEKINEKFEKSFREMCNKVAESCKELQSIEKKRMWLKLRKWVFLNRIMEYKSKKSLIRELRTKTLGDKKFFIPDQIDISYRDLQHPDIKKSPYYVLAGLFKLKNTSPEYALKHAVTSGSGLFKHLEIDKEKLNEIKSELKTNPGKFIDVWESVLDKEFQKYYEGIEDQNLLEYEKSYRLRHEGKSITDYFPKNKEWEEFKVNWTSYKKTVIEMARKLTIDLLYEVIETSESGEKSEDYQLLYEIVKKEDDDLNSLNSSDGKLRAEEIEQSINKLFNTNTDENASENSKELLDNKYKDKEAVDIEISKNKSKLIDSLQDGKLHVISAIYEKEKTLLEDTLKKYYELKLNLLNIDINERLNNYDTTVYSIDEFIAKLKEVTFTNIVLSDEKKLPEALNRLVRENGSISKDKHNKREIDKGIENFMKQRFNEIIYNKEDQKYIVDPNYLKEITSSKTDIDNIEQLVSDYREDKISLNEEIYEVSDRKEDDKVKIHRLKLKLVDAINRFHSQYDLENLKLKYIDYISNKPLYIYKILCNIKDSKDMYVSDVSKEMEHGKLLLEMKDKAEVNNKTNETKNNMTLYDLDYLNKVKNLSLRQDAYVKEIEKLNDFTQANQHYKDLLYSQYFDNLDFTAKYDVTTLSNNPRCDIKSLYETIKQHVDGRSNKRLRLAYDDYIVRDGFIDILEADNVSKEVTASDQDLERRLVSQESKALDIKPSTSVDDLRDYIKKNINPGLKYNQMIDLIVGKNKTLRDLILDDDEKNPSEYLKEHELDSIFSHKIPLDLVKTALDVYDARLIKALKLALLRYTDRASIGQHILKKETEFKMPFNLEEVIKLKNELEFSINKTESNLLYNPSELTQDKLKKLTTYIRNDQRDLKKISYKIDEEVGGEKVLAEYRKGSVFDTIINLHALPEKDKHEAIRFVTNFLKKNVNKPDFDNKYSLLKYIYDYYMGTLSLFNENHKQDTLNRLNNLNNILFYNKAKQLYHSHENPNTAGGINSFLNSKAWQKHLNPYRNEKENHSDEVSFEKRYPMKEEINRRPKDEEAILATATPEELKKVNKIEQFAYELPYKNHKEGFNYVPREGDFRSKFTDVKLRKYWKIYTYQNLKDEGSLNETYNDNSAKALYLTEDFRMESERVEKENRKLQSEVHNLHDRTDSTPVYNKLVNKENPYDSVFEEMFADYFRKKKERIEYTEKQLGDIKAQFSHTDNLISGRPELLHNMDFQKSDKSDQSNIKLDLTSFIKLNSIYKEYPVFNASDLTDIVELDNASSFAQHGKLASIPHWLVEGGDKPDANNKIIDFNISAKKWYEKQIENLVDEFFNHRLKLEKCTTRDELRALDKDLSQYFSISNIDSLVRNRLTQERLMIHNLQDIFENRRNGSKDMNIQTNKLNLDQYKFNKDLKDPEAFYKLQAYEMRKKYDYNTNLEAYLATKPTRSLRHIRKFNRDLEDNKDNYSFSNYYEANLKNKQFKQPNIDDGFKLI
jgi:hypothetical protein